MQPVTVSDLQDARRIERIQECSPLNPSCDVSHERSAHVDGYKDELKIQPQNKVETQTNSPERAVVFPSAESSNGACQCLTSEDTVTFKVDAPGDLYTLSHSSSYNDDYFFVWLIQVGSVLNNVRSVTIWVACQHLLKKIFVVSLS